MNADVFFTIGATHKICQDYALVKSDGAKSYLILSDGCSTAPDTDFGSRLLATAAKAHLYQNHFTEFNAFLYGILGVAHTYCRTLDLPDESLSATLLLATIESDNAVQTSCVGDGAIAALKSDGSIFVIEYEFPSGAPYYLRYQLDSALREEYSQVMGHIATRKTYVIERNGSVGMEMESQIECTADQPVVFQDWFPIEQYKAVALFSDGIKSFMKQEITNTSKTSVTYPSHKVIHELMSFKGCNGAFVQRRCNRVLKNLASMGISHYDDLSMGVINTEI